MMADVVDSYSGNSSIYVVYTSGRILKEPPIGAYLSENILVRVYLARMHPGVCTKETLK